MKKLFAFLMILMSPTAALADTFAFDLRLASFTAFQNGGYTTSGIMSVQPSIKFTPSFGVAASVGGSYLMGANDTRFVALESVALLDYRVSSGLGLETGGGIQYWHNNGDMLWTGAFNIYSPFQTRMFGVDKIYLGYNAIFVPANLTHAVRVGIAF